jgi:GNAT superfamily N-acetyltransferase
LEKPVNIRRARKADFPLLRKVFQSSVLGLGRWHYSPAQIQVWARAGRFQYLKSKARQEVFFVAARGPKIAGFSSVLQDEVHELYVAASFAGGGIGAKLLRAAEQELAARGFQRIRLISSMNALPFYLSKGWKKGRPMRRRLKDQVFNCLKMSKKL